MTPAVRPVRHLVALTLTPPWSWAVAEGFKPLENRTWPTKRRGWVAIHAGQVGGGARRQEFIGARFTLESMMVDAGYTDPVAHAVPNHYVMGAIVAIARIVDCVSSRPTERRLAPWWIGPYGFVLEDVIRLPKAISCRGMLGFWPVPHPVRIAVTDQVNTRGVIESER
jgi:hypothetical protein